VKEVLFIVERERERKCVCERERVRERARTRARACTRERVTRLKMRGRKSNWVGREE